MEVKSVQLIFNVTSGHLTEVAEKIHQKYQYRQLFGLAEIQNGHILNTSHKSTTELTHVLFKLHFLQPARLHHLPWEFFSCSALHILSTSRYWKLLGDELSFVMLCINNTSLWWLEFSVLLSCCKSYNKCVNQFCPLPIFLSDLLFKNRCAQISNTRLLGGTEFLWGCLTNVGCQ